MCIRDRGQAKLYLGIYFLGMPFLFMYNVLASIFNAMGDSRTPLYLLIFSSVLNVVLDIISVTWLGMGVDGVAIATVMAQGISALISFSILMKKLKGYEQEAGSGFIESQFIMITVSCHLLPLLCHLFRFAQISGCIWATTFPTTRSCR